MMSPIGVPLLINGENNDAAKTARPRYIPQPVSGLFSLSAILDDLAAFRQFEKWQIGGWARERAPSELYPRPG